jgi:hypothetical protein
MWFQVDMGSAQTFNQIEMDADNWPGDYARGYNVEVSSDGSTFTTVASATGTSSPETTSFTMQTSRYIRIVLTASGRSSQVFCGDPDAPAQDFGVSGGQPYTSYLYTDSSGNYNVFVLSSGQSGDRGSSGAHPEEPRQAA